VRWPRPPPPTWEQHDRPFIVYEGEEVGHGLMSTWLQAGAGAAESVGSPKGAKAYSQLGQHTPLCPAGPTPRPH
jgi:hypothetical protein